MFFKHSSSYYPLMTLLKSNIYGSSWDSNWSLNAAMFKKSTMLLKKVNNS